MDAIDEILAIASVERALNHEVKEINTMTRIRDKLTRAKTVAHELGAAIEERADGLLARGPELMAKAEQAFAPHEAELADLNKGLDEIEEALKLLGNEPEQRSTNASPSPKPNGVGSTENPTKP